MFYRTRFLGNSHSQCFSKMCEVPKAINTWIFERDFPIAAAWSYFQHIIHLHSAMLPPCSGCCYPQKGKEFVFQGKWSDRFAHLLALGQLEAVAQPADHDERLPHLGTSRYFRPSNMTNLSFFGNPLVLSHH